MDLTHSSSATATKKGTLTARTPTTCSAGRVSQTLVSLEILSCLCMALTLHLGDALQRAMDSSCMFNACENGKPLKSQSVAEMNKCKAKEIVNENHDGWLKTLPGMAM